MSANLFIICVTVFCFTTSIFAKIREYNSISIRAHQLLWPDLTPVRVSHLFQPQKCPNAAPVIMSA